LALQEDEWQNATVLTAVVKNAGIADSGNAVLETAVVENEDSAQHNALGVLKPGESRAVSRSFTTSDLAPGLYTALAQLEDTQQLISAEEQFIVGSPEIRIVNAPQELVSGKVTAVPFVLYNDWNQACDFSMTLALADKTMPLRSVQSERTRLMPRTDNGMTLYLDLAGIRPGRYLLMLDTNCHGSQRLSLPVTVFAETTLMRPDITSVLVIMMAFIIVLAAVVLLLHRSALAKRAE
jgi:hypothetical protein